MQHPRNPGELNPFARFWVDVWRCTRRVFSCNFQTTRVTYREAEKLSFSSMPITEPVGQSYAAWRRSALWIAAIALIIHVIIQLSTYRFQETTFRAQARELAPKTVDAQIKAAKAAMRRDRRAEFQIRATNPDLYAVIKGRSSKSRYVERLAKKQGDAAIKLIGESNLSILDAIAIIGLLVAVASSILVLLSAVFWSNLGLSRLLALIGWGILFLTPVVLALLPVNAIMDFSHIENEEGRKKAALIVGIAFAFKIFVMEGAKILAIFPGIIRSSMGLKTLLPESAAPGWIVALIAPIYALVLLLFFVTANQLQGGALLVFAALLLMLAPMVYLIFWKAVVRPHTAKEISSRIIPVRLGVVLVNAAGLVLLSLWVIDLPNMGIGDVFKFIFGLIANVLLLTVVVTDFVIRMLRAGYIQTQGFQESRLREKLDYRFAALAQIGGKRGESQAPPIPERMADEPIFTDTGSVRILRPRNDDSFVMDDAPRGDDDSLIID